jgi:hypothetical protein
MNNRLLGRIDRINRRFDRQSSSREFGARLRVEVFLRFFVTPADASPKKPGERFTILIL